MTKITEVAKEAGVSISTVSYALSGKRRISSETKMKVMKAINDLGYVPDASARRLRGKMNKIIALSQPIRNDVNRVKYNAYFMQLAWYAKDRGYDVLLLTSEDTVSDILRVTNSNLVDGVLLLDIESSDARAANSGSFGKACVCVGYPETHTGCACVDLDFKRMGENAAQLIYKNGHRRVAYLRGSEGDYRRRSGYVVIFRNSFRQKAQDLGMKVIESDPVEPCDFDAKQFVQNKILSDFHPTAIISQADSEVLNSVLDTLHNNGFSIPDDMSILSCGTYFQDEIVRCPITEMPVMPELLCTHAIDLLLSSVEDGIDISGHVELLEPKIFEHGSVTQLKN